MNTVASHVFRASVLTSLLLLAPCSQAQWSWTDSNGRRVYSDIPPDPGVPERNILKRPSSQSSARQATQPAPSGSSAAAAPSAEPQNKKSPAQRKDAAAQQAEDEKISAAKKDNCERAKRGKASLDSGARIVTLNTKGEREFMRSGPACLNSNPRFISGSRAG